MSIIKNIIMMCYSEPVLISNCKYSECFLTIIIKHYEAYDDLKGQTSIPHNCWSLKGNMVVRGCVREEVEGLKAAWSKQFILLRECYKWKRLIKQSVSDENVSFH